MDEVRAMEDVAEEGEEGEGECEMCGWVWPFHGDHWEIGKIWAEHCKRRLHVNHVLKTLPF